MDNLKQIEALENGKGIQYLLDSACKVFNNPIFVIDINYNLLAFTDIPFDDPNWKELITRGTFTAERLDFFANEGFIEDITNAEKTVVIRSEKFEYAKIAGHLLNRDHIRSGLVMMSDYKTPIDAGNIAAFEALVSKITYEIRDYDYFTMLAMTFHEDKINLLLEGAVKNPLLYNPQAQILYNDFEDYLYVAVVSAERNEILEDVYQNRLAYFKSMLKTKYQAFKFSVYKNYIVMLMSSKHSYFYGAPFFDDHADLFEQNGLYMGISGSFENMYELRNYYDQAVGALTKGLTRNDGQRIFLHNE